VKAITVPQPWAWAIVAGRTRFWSVERQIAMRGPLAIVAAVARPPLRDVCRIRRAGVVLPARLSCGAVLGTVDLVDCRRPGVADVLADGPWCLVFRSPRMVDQPIGWRGRAGLFDVPDEIFGVEERLDCKAMAAG